MGHKSRMSREAPVRICESVGVRFPCATRRVGCFEDPKEAIRFREMLKQRLEKFGLKVAENKSRVIEFGRSVWEKSKREGGKVESFDFLGFTLYCERTQRGKFKVGRKTSSNKFRQKMKAMNEWLKGVRNLVKLEQWWKVFRLKLAGHYRYYGISGNMRAMKRFHVESSKLAYKWINRRSQKRSYTYAQYRRYLMPTLPVPKIYRFYAFSST